MAAADQRSRAVVGGQANMTWLSFAALRGQIQAGKIKPLAVAGEKAGRPANVPTVAESGFPGFVAYSWSGMFAPSGTPDATIKKLTRDFKACWRPDVRRKWAAGFEIVASDGPALDAYVKAEYERWNAFIKTSNINLENTPAAGGPSVKQARRRYEYPDRRGSDGARSTTASSIFWPVRRYQPAVL